MTAALHGPNPDDFERRQSRLARLVLNMSPAELADFENHLSSIERQAIERVIANEAGAGWRASPLALGLHFGALHDLPHTRLLSEKFADAFWGRSPRQIWNLPPQHGKSLLASRWGPVWALDTDPTIKLGLFSYADHLARDHATFVRDALVRYGDDLRARLRPDRRRQDEFVTHEDGRLMAAGLSGSITGFGFNGVIVDDPFKNWEEAHSAATRRNVWTAYQSVIATRLNHRRGIPAFVIVVQTRWHEEDLTGMLEAQDERDEGEDWEVIRLPALAESDNDPLGRKVGEALAPSLHDADEMTLAILNRGSYISAGLYQQRPAPEEGGEIKRAWFQYESQFPPAFDNEITSWDMKLKDKEGGDFVVGQAWGRTGSDFWCRAQLRGQWNFVTTKVAIALMQVRFPTITQHIIENTGNGPEVMQDMRRGHGADYNISEDVRSDLGITDVELPLVTEIMRHGIPGLIAENVRGDKLVRMRRHLGILESGHMHLPVGLDWTEVLVNEAAAFPSGAHDDCVDAMSQALKRLRFATSWYPNTGREARSPKPSTRSTGGAQYRR